MIGNPRNSCMGCFKDTVDIKLLDACDGRCPFCIEKDCPPTGKTKLSRIKESLHKLKPKSALLLGGEPLLLRRKLHELMEDFPDIEFFMTTNGSMLGHTDMLHEVTKHLSWLNISIHHFDLASHEALTGIKLTTLMLRKAIAVCHSEKCNVRINTVLLRGYLDSTNKIKRMALFASLLGANSIRFSEVQNYPAMYTDVTKLIPGLPDNPFEAGCEQKVDLGCHIEATVKMTCGFVNENKPQPKGETTHKTTVIYPDGKISKGWRTHNVDSHKKASFLEGEAEMPDIDDVENADAKQLAEWREELFDAQEANTPLEDIRKQLIDHLSGETEDEEDEEDEEEDEESDDDLDEDEDEDEEEEESPRKKPSRASAGGSCHGTSRGGCG